MTYFLDNFRNSDGEWLADEDGRTDWARVLLAVWCVGYPGGMALVVLSAIVEAIR